MGLEFVPSASGSLEKKNHYVKRITEIKILCACAHELRKKRDAIMYFFWGGGSWKTKFTKFFFLIYIYTEASAVPGHRYPRSVSMSTLKQRISKLLLKF